MRLSGKLSERTKARLTTGVVLPRLKEQMLREFEAGSDRRWDIIHPSELAHQDTFCPRAVYLRITGGPVAPEKFDWGLQNIFDEGHNIHAKWQDRFRRTLPLFGDWKCLICGKAAKDTLEPGGYNHVAPYADFCCDFTGGDHSGYEGNEFHIWEYTELSLDAFDDALMMGHEDGAFDDYLIEVKSVGEGTVRIEDPELFKKHTVDGQVDLKALWKDIQYPFKTHLNQVDIYLWIAQARGMPFNKASFIYESKWNQQVKEFIVAYSEPRSMKLIDQAVKIKYAVDHKEEPECAFPGACKNCAPFDARRANTKARNVRTRVRE
jgi:CRISPR/Cas system-associated exonuclease Cas4 (RecB family)